MPEAYHNFVATLTSGQLIKVANLLCIIYYIRNKKLKILNNDAYLCIISTVLNMSHML